MAIDGEDGGTGGAGDLLGGAGGDGGDGGQGGDGGAGGNGGGEGGDGGDGGQGGDPEFYASLSVQKGENETHSNRDYVKAKGFKDLDGLVKGYRSAEQALHDSGRIKVPGEGATTEELSAFHKAIGVPDDAKGYEIKPPNGPDGKPLELNSPLIERLAGAAHTAGIPKAAFEATVGEYINAQIEEAAELNRAMDAEAAETVKEWGGNKNAKLAAVDAAARALGINSKQMQGLRQALGPKFALTMMARLGAGLGEGSLLTGEVKQFGISAVDAQKEIDEIKADPERSAKVLVKGSAEQTRWNFLLEAVAAAKTPQA